MKSKIKLTGVGRLKKTFDTARKKAESSSVIVGYTANYAIYVHEMVGANFKRPGSQAKFLEQPAREMKGDLVKQIERDLANGMDMSDALKEAGLKLQRASMEICPVDEGNLRESAFTRIE